MNGSAEAPCARLSRAIDDSLTRAEELPLARPDECPSEGSPSDPRRYGSAGAERRTSFSGFLDEVAAAANRAGRLCLYTPAPPYAPHRATRKAMSSGYRRLALDGVTVRRAPPTSTSRLATKPKDFAGPNDDGIHTASVAQFHTERKTNGVHWKL